MNPQQFALNLISKRFGGNPMFSNLIGMAKSGNSKGVEQFARNICKEKRN